MCDVINCISVIESINTILLEKKDMENHLKYQNYKQMRLLYIDAVENGDIDALKHLHHQQQQQQNAPNVQNVESFCFDSIKCGIFDGTLLHFAAGNGHIGIMSYLLNEGKSNINSQDKQGETPLMYAIVCGEVSAAMYLLSFDGCEHDYINEENRKTALIMACNDVRMSEVSKCICRRIAISLDCDINHMCAYGYNALHAAAHCGSVDSVSALLDTNMCDVSIKDSSGKTAADIALRRGHIDTYNMIISYEPNVFEHTAAVL